MTAYCLLGHPRTPDNLDTHSYCKVCKAERGKRHYEQNREEIRAKDNAKYQDNPEPAKARARAFKKSNPEYVKTDKAKRLTLKTQAGGYFTSEEWFLLCFAVGFRCLRCGQKKPLTPDHVVPISKGGTSWLHNIQPLCGPCNSSKHDKYIDYR